MRLFRSSEILGIAEDALQFALEASEDAHPNEYMGYLRGEDARALGLDRDGKHRQLDVLDVSLPEGESFFDFTQADIDEELRDE